MCQSQRESNCVTSWRMRQERLCRWAADQNISNLKCLETQWHTNIWIAVFQWKKLEKLLLATTQKWTDQFTQLLKPPTNSPSTSASSKYKSYQPWHTQKLLQSYGAMFIQRSWGCTWTQTMWNIFFPMASHYSTDHQVAVMCNVQEMAVRKKTTRK